jgi:hypothetical protein
VLLHQPVHNGWAQHTQHSSLPSPREPDA